jgi:hypothetical protein
MERALAEASDADKFPDAGRPLPGDTRQRLRNLPAITKGVSGTQPGSASVGALIAKEAKRARRGSSGRTSCTERQIARPLNHGSREQDPATTWRTPSGRVPGTRTDGLD